MEITDLLVYVQKTKASDLHLSTGNSPIIRLYGDIVPHQLPPMTAAQIKDMLYSIMTEQQRSEFERELELDFSISFGENMRFRVNVFNVIHGPAAVLRAIPAHIRSLDDLGAPPVLKKLAELRKGLILVTGPTGSGKTTTMAAMVDHINNTTAKHILTIEDPIEFLHKSKKCLINQREVGKTTHSFSKALRSALREDPDVILVGELRDLETIQLALTGAETGHLVLATLHTNSAPDSIDRVIDVFPAESKEMVRAMLSNTLQAVITQTLLKKREGGLTAAYEIMLGTPAIRNLIREGKVPQLYSMMQMGTRFGMCTMKDYINGLFQSGVVEETVARNALVTVVGEDSANGAAAKPGPELARSAPQPGAKPTASSAF